MSSLLDQSALTDLAERLVAAARAAGADAADAVAVRSVSQSVEVREGAVEESERAEGDGMGLVTSAGFRGAYLSSGQGLSATAIAGEGTAMERDYDYSSALHGADLDPAEQVGRCAGERAVERLNPRKIETKRVPVVFDRR